jgi:hypothetical protein
VVGALDGLFVPALSWCWLSGTTELLCPAKLLCPSCRGSKKLNILLEPDLFDISRRMLIVCRKTTVDSGQRLKFDRWIYNDYIIFPGHLTVLFWSRREVSRLLIALCTSSDSLTFSSLGGRWQVVFGMCVGSRDSVARLWPVNLS